MITADEQSTLDYSWQGEPFVVIVVSNADTNTLDFSWQGEPFLAVPASGNNAAYQYGNALLF